MKFPSRAGSVVGLAAAGVAFAAYPALRPYGPESGATFAADLASPAWLAAHVLGMVGFAALAFALRSLAVTGTPWRWQGRPLREVESRMWLALVLLLPYYGAEAYGLAAVGRHAAEGDVGVLAVADSFRYAPFEVTTFSAGLLVLVLVGGRLVHGTWAAGGSVRAGGLLAGLGLAAYLPQFFVMPAGRIAHGAVLGLGLLLLAYAAGRKARQEDATVVPAGDGLFSRDEAPVAAWSGPVA